MFDVGFGELALIFVLALIVFGPERLPGLARKLGRWIGRGRALIRTLSDQLEQEISAEQIRKSLEPPGKSSTEAGTASTAASPPEGKKEDQAGHGNSGE